MSSLFSIDAAFTVGVGCDLVGGFFLGRGLIAKPVEIAERAQTLIGASPPVMAGLIRARADGEVGLGILGLGFLLQAGGYLGLIAGIHVNTGGIRAALAAALALIVIGGLLLLTAHIIPTRVRSLALSVARAGAEGSAWELRLALIGRSLGYGDLNPEDPGAVTSYVHDHFGI